MLNDWSHKVWAILKKYCPPHKARGIHDFILATKSSVWIIIRYTFINVNLYIHLHSAFSDELNASISHWIWNPKSQSQVTPTDSAVSFKVLFSEYEVQLSNRIIWHASSE